MEENKENIELNDSDLVQTVSSYKWLIPVLFLIIGIVFLLIYPKRDAAVDFKKAGQSHISKSSSNGTQSLVLNGYSWNAIDKYEVNAYQQSIKNQLLKITLESSLVSGNNVIDPSEPIEVYARYINSFYGDPTNQEIPLFFALKIADLAKNKAPNAVINRYKAAVEQKLKDANLIK